MHRSFAVTGYYEFLCPLDVFSRFLIRNQNRTNLVFILLEILIYDRNEVTCHSPFINYRYELGNMVPRHILFFTVTFFIDGWVGLGEASEYIINKFAVKFVV